MSFCPSSASSVGVILLSSQNFDSRLKFISAVTGLPLAKLLCHLFTSDSASIFALFVVFFGMVCVFV
ncbi:MAG: hypothetical protein EB158_08355 [Nitrosopumilaceae archaeon]|nr:hypothetical protein [Nitrosopumilaceae archaeon]